MKRAWKCLHYIAIVMLLLTLVGGCAEDSIDNAVHKDVADPIGTVTGKVIDAQTREGLAGARVLLKVNGEYREQQTADDLNGYTDAMDTRGDFTFVGVPIGTHQLTVVMSGYADRHTHVSVSPSNDNSPTTTLIDYIELERPFDLFVYLTDDTGPVSGGTVYVDTDYLGFNPNYSAVSDESGLARITALPQNRALELIVPAFDGDGDFVYDYQTAMSSYTGSTNSDNVHSIVLAPARRDDAIEILDDNLEVKDFGMVAGPASTMRLVFNYPVRVLSDGAAAWTLSYVNDLVPANRDDFGDTIEIGVTAEPALADTVLELTPQSALIVNESYTLNGTVAAIVDGVEQILDISLGGIIVYDDTPAGIAGSAMTITLDNYNTTTNDFLDSGEGEVYINFPEKVRGTVRYISKTWYDGEFNQTTVFNNAAIEIAPEPLFNNGLTGVGTAGGNYTGIRWRQSIQDSSRDHTETRQALYTLGLDIMDAEGNRFVGELRLPVE